MGTADGENLYPIRDLILHAIDCINKLCFMLFRLFIYSSELVQARCSI